MVLLKSFLPPIRLSRLGTVGATDQSLPFKQWASMCHGIIAICIREALFDEPWGRKHELAAQEWLSLVERERGRASLLLRN